MATKITGGDSPSHRPSRTRASSAVRNKENEERLKEKEEEERKQKEKERQSEFLAEKVFMQRQRNHGLTGQLHGSSHLSKFVLPSLLDSYVKRNHFEGKKN